MIPTGILWGASILAGLVGAVSGMGSGIILVPVLTHFGVDIKQAIAVSAVSVLVISNSAASISVKRHLQNLRVSSFLEIFALIGAGLGAAVLVTVSRRLLFFLCAGIFFITAVILWLQRKETWKPLLQQDVSSQWLGWVGSYYDEVEGRTITYRGGHAVLASLLIGVVAFISGSLGIGGSALTVLVNNLVVGLPPKVALTTSHLIMGVAILVCVEVYLEAGLFSQQLVTPVIVGAVGGALIGSKVLIHLTNRIARTIFLYLLILWGIEMVSHGMWGI